MRKALFAVFVTFSLLVVFQNDLLAARYAQCDACGLCKDTTRSKGPSTVYVRPSSWHSCFTCLYPLVAPTDVPPVPCETDEAGKPLAFVRYSTGGVTGITPTPGDFLNPRCDTLLISDWPALKPTIQPKSGRMFTDIGCVAVGDGAESFNNPNASVDVVQVLTSIVMGLVGALGILFIMINAVRMLTSQGDPEKIQDAKQALINTIIGVLFSIFGLFIFRFVVVYILRIPGIS